jgi:Cd2+/Zn2+-exporting ATPase
MKRYKYNILNLDCANCAREIEEELNNNERFNNVVVNFNTSKISFESEENISLKELNELVKAVEPEADIVDEAESINKKEYSILTLVLGVLIGLVAQYIKLPFFLNTVLMLVSYVLLLYKHAINAVKVLCKNKTLNENALIVISAIGAFAIGESFDGMVVVALYTLGKILEEKAINKTRDSVKDLLDIKQNFANLKVNDEIKTIDVEEIKLDDVLIVKKGEKVPVDGIVTSGSTKLNTSALTGESELVSVAEGDKILSGSINEGEVIELKATELFENSTVSRILTLIEEATDKKANSETMVAKISKVYTPVIILLAVVITILLPVLGVAEFSESLYRGLTFLVISCPCAIAISVPLSYFVGIGMASKNNVLIKGSNYLDNLMHLKKIIFDKTGTLTTGSFNVTSIEIFDNNYTREDIIEILTKGESFSNHPIAKSIMKLANEKVNGEDVENYKEISGKGIEYEIDNKQIKVGTIKICDDCKLEASVHLNIDGKHVASITIDDGVKAGTSEAISGLKKLGIRTYMFTGDKKDVALEIGKKLDIDEIKYEMLPQDKFSEYEKVAKDDEAVAFVGDGINDAPVLKRAFIGISMGEIGSAAAIEASDIVIMKDDLRKIPIAIKISRNTNKIIKQNLIFAILVKIIILMLSVFGYAAMWMAVFADTGVTLITILNTLRLKRMK